MVRILIWHPPLDPARAKCLTISKSIWCIAGIEGHERDVSRTEIITNWAYNTPNYVHYTRP